MGQDFAAFVAPFTLLLGAGLLAVGLLSLVGVHTLASEWRERLALAAGLAFMLATQLLFAFGAQSHRFLNGQRADVLECRLEAERALPEERHKESLVLNDRIVACMTRLGYDWTTEHRRCRETPAATNPFCYLPQTPFDRWLTRLQTTLE